MTPSLIDFGGNQGRQPIQDRQAGFTGGLNTVSDPSAVAPNQAVQLTNIRLTAYGAAAKRLGTKRTTSSAASHPLANGGYWPAYNTFLYFDSAGNVFLDSNMTFVASIGSPTVNTTSGVCAFVESSLTPVIYLTDPGSQTLYKYDFSSWSTVWSAVAPISRMVVYNQRLWGWDHTASTGGVSTVGPLYYSNLSTATSSAGGDSLAVAGSNGGKINVQTFGLAQIMSCIVVGSSLMILHKKGVSRLTGFGQSDITVTPQSLSDTDAIVGPDAVCEADGVAWFASQRGLVQMTESSVGLVGTVAVPDPLPAAFVTALANSANLLLTKLIYNAPRQEVWVMVPTVGLYVYHTVLGAWSGPWNGPYTTSTFCPIFVKGDNTVYISDSANNYALVADQSGFAVQQDLVHSDGTGGSAFTSVIQCHRMFGGSAYVQGTETTLPVGAGTAKAWRMANVLATLTNSATAPTVTVASVYGGSNTATFTTPSGNQQTYYNPAGGAGPYVDVTITDAGTTASQYAGVEVTGFALGTR